MIYKVTPEHHTQFWMYVRKWQRLLNLMDWRLVDYTHSAKGIKTVGKDMACVYDISGPDRFARLALGKAGWTDPVTEDKLNRLAFHELMHVRLHDALAAAASGDEDGVAGPEHSAIIVLENLIFDGPETE